VVAVVRLGAGESSGCVVEAELLAGQAFQFGDELAFAPLGCEAVVPVQAEVNEVGVGVGEQVPADGEDGVPTATSARFLPRRLTIRL